MGPSSPVTEVRVENITFPSAVKPPGSTKLHFLGGAGVRGLEIEGKFVKFTASGVYLEDDVALSSLAVKWKGKSADELTESVEFFREIVTGDIHLTINRPTILRESLCIAIMKSSGIYTDSEAKAMENFIEVFKDKTFLPGHSVLFTQSQQGLFTISFTEDETIPEAGDALIENKLLAEAFLESVIGERGVSPAARKSIGTRLSTLLSEKCSKEEKPVEADGKDINVA